MRKTITTITVSAMLLLSSIAFKVSASSDIAAVSPALEIISESFELVKTGLCDTSISFSKEDFIKASGVKNIKSITISTLPEVISGKLMLGSREVMKNQTIKSDDLTSLCFIPSFDYPTEASFRVKINNYSGNELSCTVYTLKEINYAPVTGAAAGDNGETVTTFKNITVFGNMKVLDPERDSVTFEITKQPQKGIVSVYDRKSGAFAYTPVANYTGKDSFTYVATDRFGNTSKPVQVSIQVEKAKSDIIYTDLLGHWAHNAAIKVSTAGIMGASNIGGKLHFSPDEPLTRCEFLSMALMSAGIEPTKSVSTTVFADDSQIPDKYKPYVNCAYEMGIIRGDSAGSVTSFYPDSTVTRAECAVILNNLLNLDQPVMKPIFEDSADIPVWAEAALYTLNNASILKGTGDGYISPNSVITRAQGAQIFATVMEIKNK